MEMAQQRRGESILYIFSAIEQSPRFAERQTPQRDGERQEWREREGREGVLECSAPRERAALDGVVVHLRVCICGECGEPPPQSWLGAPLSKVFVVEVSGEGHSWWGYNFWCLSMNKACWMLHFWTSWLHLVFITAMLCTSRYKKIQHRGKVINCGGKHHSPC